MADDKEGEAPTGDAPKAAGARKPRVSSRVPPVIEGEAIDLAPPTPAKADADAPPPNSLEAPVAPYAPSEFAADAPSEAAVEPDGVPPPPDPEPVAPAARRSRAPLYAGLAVVVAAGIGGYLAWDPDTGTFSGDLPGLQALTGDAPKTAAPAPSSSPSAPKTVAANPSSSPPVSPPMSGPKPAAPPVQTAPVVSAPRPDASRDTSASKDTSVPKDGGAKDLPAKVAVSPTAAAPAVPAPTTTAPRAESPVVAPSAPPLPAPLPAPPLPAAPASAAVDPTRLSDLDKKLAALDAKIGSLSDAVKLGTDLSGAVAAQSTKIGGIEGAVAALDKRLAALEAKLSQPKADTRAPESRDALMAREADNAAARTVVAQALAAAVQAGAPFTDQVAALRGLGADDAMLTRLSASATGVATLPALRSGFAALRPKFQTNAPPAVDAGYGDKLMARLSSLVTVRSAAERPGASPDAIASRISAALDRNDVVGALDQYKTLPDADRATAKGWADAAAARLQAEADARALLASSLGALAKPKS